MPVAMYFKKIGVTYAVRFDPTGEHKKDLPPGVVATHNAGCDNYAYEGILFYTTEGNSRFPLLPGEWVIYEDGVDGCRSMTDWEFHHRHDVDSI